MNLANPLTAFTEVVPPSVPLDPDEIVDDVIINKIMLTNVLAPQALVKACLPYFPKDSAIVNITSVESEFPFPNHSLYASSKAALKRYSELAAIELEKRKKKKE